MMQTFSTRTICCKLSLDAAAAAAIRTTAEAFNAAATYCASVAWTERITNKNKLHHIVYGPTRSTYGLGAQLACCARDKAAEAVRAARANGSETCPTFQPDSSIRYDARTYRLLSLDRVSLNTLTGRVIGQLVLGDFQRRHLYDTTWTIGGAELVQRDGQVYLHITQTKANPTPDEPTGFLGVDLGIVNLAADSDGEMYSARPPRSPACGGRGGKNARREARFQKEVNHRISKALVQKARTTRKALALEDLTQIRARGTVRRTQRRARHSWAFRQLRTFLTYKAQREGVLVIAVDPRNTSRTCAVCGHCDTANRVDQAHFRCRSCGHTACTDARYCVSTAAVNIASRATRQMAWCAASAPLGPPCTGEGGWKERAQAQVL